MKKTIGALVVLTTILAAFLPSSRARSALPSPLADIDFSCTGKAHAEAIALWNGTVRSYVEKQISIGLKKDGDTQLLYKIQSELQSFTEMTRRCRNRQQLEELVDTISPAFSSLSSKSDEHGSLGWICTGGSCAFPNRLFGKEVPLYSAQFLGLIGAIATATTENVPEKERTNKEKTFLTETASIISTQLDRWLSPAYFKKVSDRAQMTAADATDAQSKYFFTDRDLWYMTALSDLSEIHKAGVIPDKTAKTTFKSLQSKREGIASLFDLFQERITMIGAPGGSRAEIDRGYWRNYADSRYASYEGKESPIICSRDMFGVFQRKPQVPARESYVDSDLGWDLSHMRRIVPALDTFVRNRKNISDVFGYSKATFNPENLRKAFAGQIATNIWNKDKKYPLFSNFWDGSNGWYRAGYDSGQPGDCRPGQAPYSLAWSFPTGSYPQWSAFNIRIRTLTTRLYQLFDSSEPSDVAFTSEYYPLLTRNANTHGYKTPKYDVWRMAFLSSIPGN